MHLESNPIPTRDAQRVQTNLVCTKTQRPHKEPDLCLSVSCEGTGVQRPAAGTGALGAADLGMAYALLEEISINPTIELPELAQDWETDSWSAQQKIVHQDPGERSSDPTGDCPRHACGCPGVSGRGMVGGGLLQGWGH